MTTASDTPTAAETTTRNPAAATRSRWRRVASVISGIVLTLLNLVASIPVGFALITPQPTGPGDTDVLDGIAILSTFGASLSLFSFVLTGTATSVGWLGRWWLIIPATLLTAALIRAHAVPYP